MGTITDQSGATVGQTHITVRNLATGFDRTLNASEDGSYSVAALPAGKYEVKAEAQGFRSMTLQATVEVGTTTTVNLTMELGSVSEVVDVVADATPQMNVLQRVGGSVGTAILAVVLERAVTGAHTLAGVAAGYGTAFWFAAGLTAAAILPCIVLLRAERAARAAKATDGTPPDVLAEAIAA